MPSVGVWLNPETVKALDEIAAELMESTGIEVTRSDVLKQAIREFLKSR